MTYPAPFNNQTQRWAYDDAGNLKSRTTVNGERQDFFYDIRNRKISMSWANGADSATYGYDEASRLTNANNPNSNVTRAYDAAGRLTQDQQQVTGLGIKTVTYPQYDDDGKLKEVSAAGVYGYLFDYDAMGRFETISTGNSVNFRYAYDAASNETDRYAYFNGNTIDQIYGRDSLNRISSRVLKKNGHTIPGSTEAYTYDHMNRLTEVNRDSVADSFAYYWSGELWTAQYGGGPHMPYTEGQDPDLDTADTVDPNAGYQPPETAEAEPAPPADDTPPPDQTLNTTPSPDPNPPSDTPPAEDPSKGQKTVEDYLGDGKQGPDGPQPDLPSGRSVRYTLDQAGNRTSVTDNANGNATYAPNHLNQYTSVGGSSVINGPEHEIQTYDSVTYYYINDEHLKRVTGGSNTYNLSYDALGRCVKRSLNSAITYYIYDGEKPILEYRSTDLSNPARNVYGKGVDEILMRYDPSFTPALTCYYQQNHEGSVTHLLSTGGNVIESYKYDAFGAPAIYDANGTLLSSSAKSNRFLFTGREYANLFGFYEYRARAYHPTLGRFMSEDPKGTVRRAGLGTAPADWTFAAHPDEAEFNLFRYCVNDPVNNSDPTGLDSIQNADGSFSYTLQHDLSPQSLSGSYVEHGVSRNNVDRSPVQCARTARVLAGTALGDGWHNAPSPEGGAWSQGAAVSNNTPFGSLVARGWEHGVYPNRDAHDRSYEGHPDRINHAGIFVGLSRDGKYVFVLDQFVDRNGQAKLEVRPWAKADWSQVASNRPHESSPTQLLLRAKENE
jgi:RHS repeat-associated protein